MKIKDLVYVALFTALITVCAQITIPTTIPFTLQTFAVFLTVGLLRNVRALISVVTYVLLGIIGVPVFSGFKGGIGVILNATGGFIIGFIFIPVVALILFKVFGYNLVTNTISMIAGTLLCYLCGCLWFSFVYSKGSLSFLDILKICVLPFLIFDALKIITAVIISDRLLKIPEVKRSLGSSDKSKKDVI